MAIHVRLVFMTFYINSQNQMIDAKAVVVNQSNIPNFDESKIHITDFKKFKPRNALTQSSKNLYS